MDMVTSHRVTYVETINEGHISSTSDHLPIICKFKTEIVSTKQKVHERTWIAWNRIEQTHIDKYQDELRNLSDKVLDKTRYSMVYKVIYANIFRETLVLLFFLTKCS